MHFSVRAWAVLRPLLFALAAATSWIALTAGAASADSSSSRDSLLGSVGSSLHSAAKAAAGQVKDVLEPVEPALAGTLSGGPVSRVPELVQVPSLAPVVENVTGLADSAIQAVPVVNKAVPAGTVGTLVDPAVGAVDQVVGGTVEAVAPVASTALEPLDPILAPVTEAAPLPPAVPGAQPGGVLPVIPDAVDAIDAVKSGESAAAAPTASPEADDAQDSPAANGRDAATGAAAGFTQAMIAGAPHSSASACDPGQLSEASAEIFSEPSTGDVPSPAPSGALPEMPDATSGGAGSSGGNGPSPAGWLSALYFHIPAAGNAAIEGRLLAAPAPVSFDPGSSPD